jgi:two-component system nitrogen regulation response regulator GlnG
MPQLLLIDDDRSQRTTIAGMLKGSSVQLQVATTGSKGIEIVKGGEADVVLLDVSLPDMSGIEACRQIHALAPKVPVIVITAGGSSDTAIEAMKLGAFDYLLKPLDLTRIATLVAQALEIRRLMHVPVELQVDDKVALAGDLLIGRTSQMQEVYKAVGRVAPQDVATLIRGESGSGKELVARAIYHHSHRAGGPFLAVNCAALSESLLESELFGHEKGSFTGAAGQRIGKFEQCNEGTLFLDEVGDMSPRVQSKVLRVLQEQRFERVGGTRTIQTDVRIIAATNRDLEKMVTAGAFREDLLYRLNGFTIQLPPLRERKADIRVLLDWFLAKYRRELGKDLDTIAPDALEMLLNYRWPGNVRQLQNVVRQALVQSTGPVLIAAFLPHEIVSSFAAVRTETTPDGGNEPMPDASVQSFVAKRLRDGSEHLHGETIALAERVLITTILTHTHNNQSKAADILGITRGSLRRKIRDLGLLIDCHVASRGSNKRSRQSSMT